MNEYELLIKNANPNFLKLMDKCEKDIKVIKVLTQDAWIYFNGFQYHCPIECEYIVINSYNNCVSVIFTDGYKRGFFSIQEGEKIKITDEWGHNVLYKGNEFIEKVN